MADVADGSMAVFKRSLRHVRYHPNSGAKADIPAFRICANFGLMRCSKDALFDHLVSARNSYMNQSTSTQTRSSRLASWGPQLAHSASRASNYLLRRPGCWLMTLFRQTVAVLSVGEQSPHATC